MKNMFSNVLNENKLLNSIFTLLNASKVTLSTVNKVLGTLKEKVPPANSEAKDNLIELVRTHYHPRKTVTSLVTVRS